MDNRVYVHVDNLEGGGDKRGSCPQGVGMNERASMQVVHGSGEIAGFLHIPRIGKVTVRYGNRCVSPLSTPLLLLRQSSTSLFIPNSTYKLQRNQFGSARCSASWSTDPRAAYSQEDKVPGVGFPEKSQRLRDELTCAVPMLF